MNRRQAIVLVIPSVIAASLMSCGDKNPSLIESPMWYPAPSMSDKKMELAIRKFLSEDKILKFKWECGGDQAIVFLDPSLNENEKPDLSDQELYDSITLYIMNFLNLPDVGEFAMDGGGEFKLIDGEQMVFEFESILNSYVDYNPETKEVINVNDPKIDTSFTGVKVPFK